MAGKEVIVVESAETIGTETSSRNSEIIHAGIYYPQGSLKAQFCGAGKLALYPFCESHGVTHRRSGKIIVATNEAQLPELERLKSAAAANGVTDLDPELPMFPRLLQAIGYRTALVGKWHMRRDSRPRPGFDHWLSFRGQGDYIDPIFNRNGTEYQARGYITDLLTDEAVEFLRLSRGRPFCLYLAHKAVHAKIVPAERHANLYAGAKLPDPAADTLAGKPRWLRQSGARHVLKPPSRSDEEWREYWRQQALGYYRALAAVDEGVGRVLDAIDEIGATNQTMVVLTSDNGLLLGEHGRGAKRVAYEESIRVPLLVSGPGVRNRGRVISDLVLNVDLAPTLLELGGAAIQSSMHGRSLAPLLAGEDVPWRSSFLYEYYVEHGKPAIPTMLGVRTRDWKYTQYPNILDFEELYHLAEDPHELNNLADDPSARGKLGELRAERERLTREIS